MIVEQVPGDDGLARLVRVPVPVPILAEELMVLVHVHEGHAQGFVPQTQRVRNQGDEGGRRAGDQRVWRR